LHLTQKLLWLACVADVDIIFLSCDFCLSSSSLWSPYGIRQTIIFSSCGFFLSIFFDLFSSPDLSGRTLDYHTSTHGVALVQI